jgi:hypothetical protein
MNLCWIILISFCGVFEILCKYLNNLLGDSIATSICIWMKIDLLLMGTPTIRFPILML